jgi:rubrerythrin
MNIEEAIASALEFERRVHKTYVEAVTRAKDQTARRVFEVLAAEELGHVHFLQQRLSEWQRDGRVGIGVLHTVLPSHARIEAGVRKMRARIARAETRASEPGDSPELEMLKKALDVEGQTLGFYRRMVSELPEAGRELFGPFVAIEEGHSAIVQAEIDSVKGLGFWFDVMEFQLEAG